jgi:CubicO group peptidase (beta-lactamase class C family)
MRFSFTLAAICAGSFLSTFVVAQNSASEILTPQTDAFIQGLLREWGTPGGVSVAIVRMGSSGTWQVETKGYGVAKLDGTNFTADTRLSIGSNSKVSVNRRTLLAFVHCLHSSLLLLALGC